MRALRSDYGVRSVLCEGGPHLNSSLLREGLVDELFLCVSPRIAGDPRSPQRGGLRAARAGRPGAGDAARSGAAPLLPLPVAPPLIGYARTRSRAGLPPERNFSRRSEVAHVRRRARIDQRRGRVERPPGSVELDGPALQGAARPRAHESANGVVRAGRADVLPRGHADARRAEPRQDGRAPPGARYALYFQYASVREFCEPVEQITGRTVRSFHSSTDTQIDGLSLECFIFYPEGQEGPSRSERPGP